MRKLDAIRIFGTQSRLAAALGLGRSAVSQWPDDLPQRHADQVQGAALRLGLLPDVAKRGHVTMQKIRKAVFPVAGMGTRFLPATKASPKEMMPVVDKPLIQYAVEEALEAGITEMVFITGRNKRSIEDHFDKAYELENELAARGKQPLLDILQSIIPKSVSCIYIRQTEALGLGHAVLCAEPVVGDEPFAVILADDLIDGNGTSEMKRMVGLFGDTHCSVLGVEQVPPAETSSYGIVEVQEGGNNRLRVSNIVEKPRPEEAPSNLAVVGRYILTPRIFHHLQNVQPGKGGEIQLTDGIFALMQEQHILAHTLKGTRYDCGSKLGYLKATLAYGLKHAEVGDEFTSYLKEFCTRLP
ncbi:UTP--glucose-1-phosphate uridylyltransferase GalU [Chitiniphilus purpureus]|uniref:UTP--glucose-1-phosphate uridylyltransferase n=1 Tax=Chitiniphilus purpureus TaxID=2981137 RepID=A0ABY6DH78_9NEIS|nr:UTP--glucose-1-phosphate uridylyltransferase GalU [Chitiniphilus sp. CD1]UXY13694.1 UTP--glucose-1-phosphate uridylyltransferase GalU [Chitiniphilus sp. CD1]